METNLVALKTVSKTFLYLPMELNEEFPFIAHHPYFNSPVVLLNNKIANIYDDLEKREEYFRQFEAVIERMDTPYALMSLLQSQYMMTWLKYSKQYLSEDDFSELLGEAWVLCENANMDKNVPISESVRWFRKARKEKLMTPEEYEVYKNIPEAITLYRGVANGRVEKGMSWTNNKEKAIWFRDRFGGGGYLLEMTVRKEDVLAYFDRRDEYEYLVYPKKYRRN